jgi:hypothetical protein
MKPDSLYLRIFRLSFGISLLVYLLTKENLPAWLPYYTFQTNLLVGTWFTLAGAKPGEEEKHTFWMKDSVKGAVTTYITVTGLVYNLVLIPYEIEYAGHISTSSVITHMIVPVIMILDYVLAPASEKPSWQKLYFWLTYPILYAAGTLIRGIQTGFWPYPFIDPEKVGSIPQLIVNYIGLIAVHAGLSAIYLAVGRRKWGQKKRFQSEI